MVRHFFIWTIFWDPSKGMMTENLFHYTARRTKEATMYELSRHGGFLKNDLVHGYSDYIWL